jgi:hypothetical protein
MSPIIDRLAMPLADGEPLAYTNAHETFLLKKAQGKRVHYDAYNRSLFGCATLDNSFWIGATGVLSHHFRCWACTTRANLLEGLIVPSITDSLTNPIRLAEYFVWGSSNVKANGKVGRIIHN